MKLILLRLTPKLEQKNIYAYVDIEIPDIKIKLKGLKVIFYKGKLQIHMPTLPIENSNLRYTPIVFLDDEFLKNLRLSVNELIVKEYPLSEWQKGVYSKHIV